MSENAISSAITIYQDPVNEQMIFVVLGKSKDRADLERIFRKTTKGWATAYIEPEYTGYCTTIQWETLSSEDQQLIIEELLLA